MCLFAYVFVCVCVLYVLLQAVGNSCIGGSGSSGGSNNALGISVGTGGASTVNGSGNAGVMATQAIGQAAAGESSQSQFLLAKFMQPTLTDAEWADFERRRANR